MSDAQTSMTPTTDDFASMFEASVESNSMKEGSVISGRVTAIEKDIVVIDVGLKTEGRVPLREFYVPGQSDEDKVKVGDDVDIYLERIENALGDAILSRDKAHAATSLSRAALSSKKAVQNSVLSLSVNSQKAKHAKALSRISRITVPSLTSAELMVFSM